MALALLTLNKSGEIPVFIELPTEPALPFATDFENIGNSGLVCNLFSRFSGDTAAGISGAIFSQTGYAYLTQEAIGFATFSAAGFYNGSLIGYKEPFSSAAPSNFPVTQSGVSIIGGVQSIGPISTIISVSPFTTDIDPAGDFAVGLYNFETKSDVPQVGTFIRDVLTDEIYFTSLNASGFFDFFKAFDPEIGENESSFYNGSQIYHGGEYRLLYLSNIGSNLTFIDYESFGAPGKWRIQFDDASLNALIGSATLLVNNTTQTGFVLRFDTGTDYRWILIAPDHSGYQEIIITYADSAAQEFAYPTLGGDTGLEIAFDDAGNLYGFGYDFDNDVTYGMNSAFPNYNIQIPVVPRPVPVRLPCIDGGMPCIPLIKEEKTK